MVSPYAIKDCNFVIKIGKWKMKKGYTDLHLNGDLRFGDKDAITICIQPFPVVNEGSGKVEQNMPIAGSFLVGFDGMRSQSSDPNIAGINLIHIYDATVDHNPSPAHVLSQLPQIATDQSTSHARSSIDDQDSPFPSGFQHLPDQDVVLKDLECDYGSAECSALAVTPEERLQHSQFPGCQQRCVCVAQFGSG